MRKNVCIIDHFPNVYPAAGGLPQLCRIDTERNSRIQTEFCPRRPPPIRRKPATNSRNHFSAKISKKILTYVSPCAIIDLALRESLKSAYGALAQLVARYNGIVEARGSTPLCSTIQHQIRTCSRFGFVFACSPHITYTNASDQAAQHDKLHHFLMRTELTSECQQQCLYLRIRSARQHCEPA